MYMYIEQVFYAPELVVWLLEFVWLELEKSWAPIMAILVHP